MRPRILPLTPHKTLHKSLGLAMTQLRVSATPERVTPAPDPRHKFWPPVNVSVCLWLPKTLSPPLICFTWRAHHLCYNRLARACGFDGQNVVLNTRRRAKTNACWIQCAGSLLRCIREYGEPCFSWPYSTSWGWRANTVGYVIVTEKVLEKCIKRCLNSVTDFIYCMYLRQTLVLFLRPMTIILLDVFNFASL